MTTETHVHHWKIDEAPTEGKFPAKCKGCGATRTYQVGIVTQYVSGKDMTAAHRAAEREAALFIRWGDA